jgi:hypothetical protein
VRQSFLDVAIGNTVLVNVEEASIFSSFSYLRCGFLPGLKVAIDTLKTDKWCFAPNWTAGQSS